jgi:two-component sensor histidine kinase
LTDVHELRGIQERQRVLLGELQHRTRNLIAVVQAIASQSMKSSSDLANFRDVFFSRLGALSRVQSLLAETDNYGLELHDLVRTELDALIGSENREATVEGPGVMLPARIAQPLGLALHELATNALKHGALKQPAGKLAVTWRIEETEHAGKCIVLDWQETGIEVARQGARTKGYGSELIEKALPYQLGTKTALQLDPDRVSCTIMIALPQSRMNQ